MFTNSDTPPAQGKTRPMNPPRLGCASRQRLPVRHHYGFLKRDIRAIEFLATRPKSMRSKILIATLCPFPILHTTRFLLRRKEKLALSRNRNVDALRP
jgi:hypothetical protein